MEVLIIIVLVVFAIYLFKVLIPAIKLTNAQMRDLGENAGHLKYEDLEVQNIRNRHLKKELVKKYLKKGFSDQDSDLLAEKELLNYLNNND